MEVQVVDSLCTYKSFNTTCIDEKTEEKAYSLQGCMKPKGAGKEGKKKREIQFDNKLRFGVFDVE